MKTKIVIMSAVLYSLMSSVAFAKNINIYSWSEAIPAEMLKRFTKETGIKVTVDAYSSNDELLAKLKAGGSNYDIIMPSQHYLKTMINEGLLVQINGNQMSAINQVKDEFKNRWWDKGNKYSIPFAYGSTGYSVNADLYKGPTDSWKYFFEPTELSGKIGMFSSPDEVISAAQLYLGVPYCTESRDDMKKVYELLSEQKKHVQSYSDDNIRDRLSSGEILAHMWWDGESLRTRKGGSNIQYAMPKEGLVGWLDSMAVPKGAENVSGAKTFINWMAKRANVTEWANYYAHDFALKLDSSKLDNTAENAYEVFPTVEVVMSETCSPAAQKLVAKVWTDLLK